jgi:hypothetical protein
VHALLKESGYLYSSDEVLVKDIREALAEQPRRIDEWAQYSNDKRSSSGWYFRPDGDGTFEVGYYSSKEKKNTRSSFVDRATACAIFIKREADYIQHLERGQSDN